MTCLNRHHLRKQTRPELSTPVATSSPLFSWWNYAASMKWRNLLVLASGRIQFKEEEYKDAYEAGIGSDQTGETLE